MAKQQVVVPDIGGAEGAEVIELLVAVGDEVAIEQSLIVLESDKASMEIPSTLAGTVLQLLVSEGQELSEGAPILVIETVGDAEVSVAAAADELVSETSASEAVAPEPADSEPNRPAVNPDPAASEERTVDIPDIGTDEAVDIIEISVSVGDQVEEGDSLIVLESDKASMEVPAPYAGEILKVLVAEGDSVKQGDDLMVFRTADAAANVDDKTAADSASLDTAAPAKVAAPTAAVQSPMSKSVEAAAATALISSKSAYAGPAVRKLAREFGLELGAINGTGPRGRIMKEDLHTFVQNSLKENVPASSASGAGIPAIPEVDFAAFGEVEHESLSKMAKVTAANMQRSWLNVPHVTQFDDADITDLEAFRADLKAEAERRGTRLTPMPFILKALAVALRDNPKFCSSLSADGQSLIYKKYIHIGMAVDTPAGLLVPVIRDVDKKSLWQLAEEVIEVAGKARDRKLRPDDMRGGCFTVSSLGGIGGRGFTPIVNAPEVGILGVSKADVRPVWNGKKFKPRKMLPLALSYDHRVINGGDAGRFFTQYVALLSDIRRLAL